MINIGKNTIPSIINAYEKYKKINFNDNKKFLRSLESHGIKQVFYYQIKNTELINRFTNEEIEDLKKTSLFNMCNMKLHEKDIEILYKEFNEKGIIAVALKGLVIKEYYNIPELRVMGDADILIKEEDLKKVEKILNELGYFYTKEAPHHKVYEKNNKLAIEIHTTLINDELYKRKNPYNEIFNKIREINIGNERAYALSYNDQLMHLITHMITHIIYNNISLQQILDITLFINNESNNIDFEEFKIKAKECNFYDLAIIILNICHELFECNIPKDIKEDCFNCNKDHKRFILDSLFYIGNEEKVVEFLGVRTQYSFNKLLKIILPSYESIKNKYNYCNKYKILLPIAWIHRILSGGSTQEKSIFKKIKMLLAIFRISKKKNDLLKTLDL